MTVNTTIVNITTKSLLIRYVVVDFTRLIAFSISGMFIILYLLDTLKSTEAGILFAINFLILALIDYPTGVLGDLIGYRKVLIVSYLFHIGSFILLLFSDSFLPLLLYSGLAAFASSQESGTLESWFDNSYRQLILDSDPDRQHYNSFQAKKSIGMSLLSGISFISGGLIAHYFSRKILFLISLFLILFVLLLIISVIKDEYLNRSKFTIQTYFHQFLGGFKFLLSHKGIFLFFIGSTVIWAANDSIWVNFLLFPIYERYSGGQDDFTAIFRALIFASGMLWQFFIVKYISRIKRVKFWIVVTTALSNTVFFFLVYIYYNWFPPGEFDVYLLLGLFIIFQIPSAWESLEYVLRNRLNLDLVPDNIRNGVYSLLPTLTTFIGVAGALIGGYYLNQFGFVLMILITSLFSAVGVILTGLGLILLPTLSD